ncbi:MAG: DNA mismatch repair protein MutS [Rikenellaceae bacterium]
MASEKKYAQTPLMKQYDAIKAVHNDAILLFRVGDFYETFGDDAIKASGVLGITLTKRANGVGTFIELAGFPHHSLDNYLPKLVRAGLRVAVCDQLEDPKTVKGIVKRGVTELVTPGVVTGDNMLTPKGNTFLASVVFGAKTTGIAFLDLSTGEFIVSEGDDAYIDKLISNLEPKEILYQRGTEDRFQSSFGSTHYTYRLDEWVFNQKINDEKLCKLFGVNSLKGFGIDKMSEAICAAGAVLYYLEFTEHKNIKHINSISRLDEDKYVWIDKFSIRNLELFSSNSRVLPGGFAQCIDKTLTPMGGRLLRRWIALPLKDSQIISTRQQTVQSLINDRDLCYLLEENLQIIGDIERITSRIATNRISPREFICLKNGLGCIANIKYSLEQSKCEPLVKIASSLEPLSEAYTKIETEIYPDPSNMISKGGVIADGINLELDELRRISTNGKQVLSEIVEREIEATGITSLKIGFNNVFGYFIEVRNTHKDKVPEAWIRKQTLTSGERYITEELKEYEHKILGAQEKIMILEQQIYQNLIDYMLNFIAPLQKNSANIARLDCLLSFAKIAQERNYCRPEVNDTTTINIKDGRHPVIETLLAVGERYVPNDVYLDNESQQIIMITGPNMAGKSALLRQTALIVLLSQIGSFVPATSAEIGVVDKIFTRVGASDNLSEGESTFMVEMLESASILNNISNRSLILLDEIGRGTSTYDGISIAWAMVEYLHNSCKGRAKTLFATHYHELNEMENICERVKNYHVTVKEFNNNIIFLRKLVRGGTEHSFGIHVARMAGMPKEIVARAKDILHDLELSHAKEGKIEISNAEPMQLAMFQLDDPVLIQIRDQIKGLDINSLTPLEALNKLNEIKKITGI